MLDLSRGTRGCSVSVPAAASIRVLFWTSSVLDLVSVSVMVSVWGAGVQFELRRVRYDMSG